MLKVLIAIFFSTGVFNTLFAQSNNQKTAENAIAAIGNSTEPSQLEVKAKWEEVLKNIRVTESNGLAINNLKESIKALKANKSKQQKFIFNLDEYSNIPPKTSYEQLNSTVNELKAILSEATSEKNKLTTNVKDDERRLQLIPKELATLKAALSLIEANETSPGLDADSLLKSTERDKLSSNITRLEYEASLVELRLPTLEDSIQHIEDTLPHINKLLKLWSSTLSSEEKKRALSINRSSKNLIPQLHEYPKLKAIAELNLKLSDQILSSDNVLQDIALSDVKLEYVKSTLKSLEEQQAYAKKRLNLLAKAKMQIDRETGQLLRKQRAHLPSERDLKSELKTLIQSSTRNQVAILELNEQRDTLPKNVDLYLQSLNLSKGENKLTSTQAKELIGDSQSLLQTLTEQRRLLATKHTETIEILEQTISNSADYTAFLDSRLLWIISHPVVSASTFTHEQEAVKKLFSSPSITAWVKGLQVDWHNWFPLWIAVIVTVLALSCLRKSFKRRIPDLHQTAAKRDCKTIKPTVLALTLELALVLPIPLTLSFIGWRSLPSSPLGASFLTSAIFLFVALFLKGITRKKGFASSHFDLREKKRVIVHQVTTWVIPILLPILFVTQGVISMSDGEGRLLVILNLLVMSFALHYLLWPSKRLLTNTSPGFVCYLAYLSFAVFPALLAVATAVGYYVSALALREQLIDSIRIILLIMLTSALITRCLLVYRRRVASKTAEESKIATAVASPQAQVSNKLELKEKIEQITQVTEQSSKLVRVAVIAALFISLTSIWANTLPALNILDNQELWTTQSATAETPSIQLLPNQGAEATTPPLSNTTTVTLQDLLVSLIILILTYFASSNIPGLLRITILDRLTLKAGAAFGVTTIVRYIIIIVGIVLAFNNIAITWDKVQWIAAAVTLGIGFGLQEIFANFVAGLILLFERPVRIGDLVTIAGINGKVSKIEMRATTILQFNNRELIVPNKEFITGQLVNWTLSDNIMRAEVAVGIAYGSDTDTAKSILISCANKNSRVLNEPNVDVIFSAFGASSLDFIIRVYVKSVDDLVPVQSELHFAIDKAFREANIEIAFPQQDIHIRSIDAVLPIENSKEKAT